MIINAKELRRRLPDVVGRVRKGTRFTVLYRSRPAFQIIPIDAASTPPDKLEDDSLYHAPALGKSRDGLSTRDHDDVLYGR